MTGPVIVSGVKPAPGSIEGRLEQAVRQFNEQTDQLRALRIAAAGAVVLLRELRAALGEGGRNRCDLVLADLTQALRQSSNWPFPVDPAMQAAKAREHQARQRDAIVNGLEGLL